MPRILAALALQAITWLQGDTAWSREEWLNEIPLDPSQAECALGRCWRDLSEAIARSNRDLVAAISEYEREAAGRFASVAGDDPMRLTLLEQYGSECADLAAGPKRPRHLLIIGHSFSDDDQNLRLAARTQYLELVKRVCGGARSIHAFEGCRSQIVVKEDIDKEQLADYLRFVGKDSVKELVYVGHSLSDALVLGPKNLLLPVDWDGNLAVSYAEWLDANIGMLYGRELAAHGSRGEPVAEAMGESLSRVLAPGARATFYGCNLGKAFATRVKSASPDSTVEASQSAMHFEYVPKGGDEWVVDWTHPVPRDSSQVRMVPDEPGAFQEIAAPEIKLDDSPPSPDENPYFPADRATRDISLRVVLRSADRAWVSGRWIVFSEGESALLGEILGSRIAGKKLMDDAYGREAMRRIFQAHARAALEAGDQARFEALRNLRRKIDTCVDEALRLYYSGQPASRIP